MTYVQHRYIESARFKHKGKFSILNQTILPSGKINNTTKTDYNRYFSFLDESSLSGGVVSDASREDTGLKLLESDLQIVIKFSEPLHTAFLNKKNIQVLYKNAEYSVVSAINVSGESVYLALGLKRVFKSA